jgi:hypothetical protein
MRINRILMVESQESEPRTVPGTKQSLSKCWMREIEV